MFTVSSLERHCRTLANRAAQVKQIGAYVRTYAYEW
jgi:hypothetical protein